jgi:membrane protein implicated in regulation of membrane protease activity
MLGIYLFAAIIGGGLLLFSLLGGAEHDADAGHDFDHSFDHDAGASHDVAHHATVGHPGSGWAGELVLGLLRPRNFIFFLAGFGITGTLLTLLRDASTLGGLIPSVAMGVAAMLVTHATFVWLRRSDSAIDAISDADMEGCVARVVLPLTPGQRGRIACRIGDREIHVVASLAEGYQEALPPGREVVVLEVSDTGAVVMPFAARELPPSTDD